MNALAAIILAVITTPEAPLFLPLTELWQTNRPLESRFIAGGKFGGGDAGAEVLRTTVTNAAAVLSALDAAWERDQVAARNLEATAADPASGVTTNLWAIPRERWPFLDIRDRSWPSDRATTNTIRAVEGMRLGEVRDRLGLSVSTSGAATLAGRFGSAIIDSPDVADAMADSELPLAWSDSFDTVFNRVPWRRWQPTLSTLDVMPCRAERERMARDGMQTAWPVIRPWTEAWREIVAGGMGRQAWGRPFEDWLDPVYGLNTRGWAVPAARRGLNYTLARDGVGVTNVYAAGGLTAARAAGPEWAGVYAAVTHGFSATGACRTVMRLDRDYHAGINALLANCECDTENAAAAKVGIVRRSCAGTAHVSGAFEFAPGDAINCYHDGYRWVVSAAPTGIRTDGRTDQIVTAAVARAVSEPLVRSSAVRTGPLAAAISLRGPVRQEVFHAAITDIFQNRLQWSESAPSYLDEIEVPFTFYWDPGGWRFDLFPGVVRYRRPPDGEWHVITNQPQQYSSWPYNLSIQCDEALVTWSVSAGCEAFADSPDPGRIELPDLGWRRLAVMFSDWLRSAGVYSFESMVSCSNWVETSDQALDYDMMPGDAMPSKARATSADTASGVAELAAVVSNKTLRLCCELDAEWLRVKRLLGDDVFGAAAPSEFPPAAVRGRLDLCAAQAQAAAAALFAQDWVGAAAITPAFDRGVIRVALEYGVGERYLGYRSAEIAAGEGKTIPVGWVTHVGSFSCDGSRELEPPDAPPGHSAAIDAHQRLVLRRGWQWHNLRLERSDE